MGLITRVGLIIINFITIKSRVGYLLTKTYDKKIILLIFFVQIKTQNNLDHKFRFYDRLTKMTNLSLLEESVATHVDISKVSLVSYDILRKCL